MSYIVAAKRAIARRFDVVIANYGDPKDRFAYQLLAEIRQRGSETPVGSTA